MNKINCIMRNRKLAARIQGFGVVTLLLVVAAGCADRNKDNIPESAATKREVKKTLDKAEKGLHKVTKAAAVAVVKTGDATQNGATTAKVKAAILANPSIDSSNLNIDTKNNIVYIRGTVATDIQSKLAVAITKKNAPGYSINNLLKVNAKAAAKTTIKR